MVTYFGEVVYPSSRAFWDEEEEEFNGTSQNKVEFCARWSNGKPTNIKKLLIIEGETISDFVKECLCSGLEEIGVVKDESNKTISKFYQLNKQLYICFISSNFEPKFAGEFVDLISDILLNAESVIGITSLHFSKFRSTDVPNVPSFLRMLSTKQVDESLKDSVKALEQPNIVFGVLAGVLSYAEIQVRPAILYILYMDSFSLDSVSAEPLIKLLSEVTEHDINNITFAGKNFFNKGNLYM